MSALTNGPWTAANLIQTLERADPDARVIIQGVMSPGCTRENAQFNNFEVHEDYRDLENCNDLCVVLDIADQVPSLSL